jgi:hypothetical protein
MSHQILYWRKYFKYEDILIRLNFLSLHMRRRSLDALSVINGFTVTIACPSTLDAFNLLIPSSSISDYYTFYVHRNFKASPCTRRVSAANAVCTNTDI